MATASFTPANNSILVLTYASINDGSGATATITNTGGLTFTRVIRSDCGVGDSTAVEVWWAQVTTGAAMTVSVSTTTFNFGAGYCFSVAVTCWTGIDLVGGPIGLSGSENLATPASWNAAISQTLGGTTASDSIVMEVLSADGRDFSTSAPNGMDIQAGAGYTETIRVTGGGGDWMRMTHAFKSGALSTYDFVSWHDNYGHASAGIEIKAAGGGGGGGAIAAKKFMVSQAVKRATYW